MYSTLGSDCEQKSLLSKELQSFQLSPIQDIAQKRVTGGEKLEDQLWLPWRSMENLLWALTSQDSAALLHDPAGGLLGDMRNTTAKGLVSWIKPYPHPDLFSYKLMIEIRNNKNKEEKTPFQAPLF